MTVLPKMKSATQTQKHEAYKLAGILIGESVDYMACHEEIAIGPCNALLLLADTCVNRLLKYDPENMAALLTSIVSMRKKQNLGEEVDAEDSEKTQMNHLKAAMDAHALRTARTEGSA